MSKDLEPKFLLYSHIYLSSISCLTKSDGKVRLAILYQAKMYRKALASELKARDAKNMSQIHTIHSTIKNSTSISTLAAKFHIRSMDIMMKILLPAGFIALKLTGTFIDFMLSLANSNVQEDTEITTAKVRDSRLLSHRESCFVLHLSWSLKSEVLELFDLYGNSSATDSYASKGTYALKNWLSNKTVESFRFRTCVKPKLSENQFGEIEITYESLTAQDLLPNIQMTNHIKE